MTDTPDDHRDHAWPTTIRWDLGTASHLNETLWQCDALRAGQLYSRSLFGSRDEAEAFAFRMRQVEPDQRFNVEAIRASAIWN